MTAPTLTDDQKARIRHHLGYLGVAEAFTFVLGTPAGVETQFIVEGAVKRLLPETLPRVVELLDRCEATETQMFENQENLAVSKVGSIELRDDEFDKLLERYEYWRRALGNCFGIAPNPYDKRPGLGAGSSGINIPVIG